MKKTLLLFLLVVVCVIPKAQTELGKGDLAFIGFYALPNGGSDQWIALVAMAPILPGTTFYLTNKEWGEKIVNNDLTHADNYKSFEPASSNQGTYTVTVNEFLSVGQIIQIYITGNPRTTVGSLIHDSNESTTLNLQAKEVMWVYQDDRDADNIPEFVSCFYWNGTDMEYEASGNNWANPYYRGTGLDLDASSNAKNAITTFYGNTSDKCGRFDPARFQANVGTTINYSDPLANNVYSGTSSTDIVWAFPGNQPSGSDGCDDPGGPGDLSIAEAWLTNVNNVVFDQYLYTCTPPTGFTAGDVPGWFAKAQSDASWSKVTGTPDFETQTIDKEVTIDCDFTVVDGIDFKVSKLIVSSGATLTFEPNTSIAIYFASQNDGFIKLLTEVDDALNLGRTPNIIPTSASLDGQYIIEYAITESYGWHHMSSPIVTKLSDVVFEKLDLTAIAGGKATKDFVLNDGTSNPDLRNIYIWDPEGVVNGNGDLELWQPIPNDLATDNFSDQAYTIYIPDDATPLKFTVTGTLLVPDADAEVSSPIGYKSTLTKGANPSPGFGAPWWVSSNSLLGWNFVRNPFMSYISVKNLVDYYITPITDNSNAVFNTNIFQYAPTFVDTINSQSNYQYHNGSAGDTDAENIAPFAAFFVQTANDGAFNPVNIPTLSVAKKCLNLDKNGKNPFWKTSNVKTSKLSLQVKTNNGENIVSSVHLDPRENCKTLKYNGVIDALKVSQKNDVSLFIGLDSLTYGIKEVPVNFDSLSFKLGCGGPVQNQALEIANHKDFNDQYMSVLIDHKLGKTHVLNNSAYKFNNDPSYDEFRFTWTLILKQDYNPIDFVTQKPLPWFSLYPDGYYLAFNQMFTQPIEIIDLNTRVLKVINPNRNKSIKIAEKGEFNPGVYLAKTQYGIVKIML